MKDPRRLRSTGRYQRARRRFLNDNPLCAVCLRDGMVEGATELDHIIPVADGAYDFWDTENWQPICRKCHLSKTAEENARIPDAQRRRNAAFEEARLLRKMRNRDG